MAKIQYLKDIDKGYVDVIAWVISSKRINDREIEVTLRDSTDVRTLKLVSDDVKLINEIANLPKESIIRIIGEYRNGVIKLSNISTLIKASEELPVDIYSISPDDVEKFVKYSYVVIRRPKYAKVLKIQQWIMYYAREYLYKQGFVELLPPIISPCSDPGLRGARKLRTMFYSHEYELTSSVIMFKQTAVASLEKIFFVARNVREEPIDNLKTGRHLCEFTQIDIEWAFANMWDVMKLGEELIVYVMEKLYQNHKDVILEFNPEFKIPKKPFKVITYDEAVELLKKYGIETPPGQELTQEGETKLSELMGEEPFWLINFPRTSRGFYYIEDPDKPGYNKDFNLILPKGFGELIDGGEREYRYEGIVKRLQELGEDLRKYEWFLELAKIGIPPSAGWGLGVERFTRYVLGLKYIWEAVPFPKVPGIVPTP